VTITGGKATTLRAMAEKTADVVCEKLGITTLHETNSIVGFGFYLLYGFLSNGGERET
jgi:glycerol-3-phosphate dehydrogenase